MSDMPSLPPATRGYFQADRERDYDSFVTWFANDATVIDDGKTFRGHDAIRELHSHAAANFQSQATVLSAEVDIPVVKVVARVEGNFPGSPVNLAYRFELEGGLIETLTIEVA